MQRRPLAAREGPADPAPLAGAERLLIVYPVVVAVLIGLALSRGPGAAARRVPQRDPAEPGGDHARQDADRHDAATSARLFQAIQPVPVATRAQALADVRSGATIAALIIPADLPQRLATRRSPPTSR